MELTHNLPCSICTFQKCSSYAWHFCISCLWRKVAARIVEWFEAPKQLILTDQSRFDGVNTSKNQKPYITSTRAWSSQIADWWCSISPVQISKLDMMTDFVMIFLVWLFLVMIFLEWYIVNGCEKINKYTTTE